MIKFAGGVGRISTHHLSSSPAVSPGEGKEYPRWDKEISKNGGSGGPLIYIERNLLPAACCSSFKLWDRWQTTPFFKKNPSLTPEDAQFPV